MGDLKPAGSLLADDLKDVVHVEFSNPDVLSWQGGGRMKKTRRAQMRGGRTRRRLKGCMRIELRVRTSRASTLA
jgi:hypothetical protein